jgi:hypothetical protein
MARDMDRAGKQPKPKKAVVEPVLLDADIAEMFKKGKPCHNTKYTVTRDKSGVNLLRNSDNIRLARSGRLNEKKCCWIHLDHPDLQFLMTVCAPFSEFGSLFTDTYEVIHYRHLQEAYNKLQERKLASGEGQLI